MRPAKNIKKIIRNAAIHSDEEVNQAVLRDLLKKLPEADDRKSALVGPNIRRIIMKSPITKLAAAAVIVLIGAVITSLWQGSGSGVALADVLTRIEQVKAYMYKMSQTVTGRYPDGKPINVEVQSTVLVSQEHGVKINYETSPLPITGQRILQEIYILPAQKTITILMPNEKKYSEMEFDETSLEEWAKGFNDPSFMVRQILSCEHTSLGKSIIDGIEVEEFQTTDRSISGETFSQFDVKMKIWVDVKTQLPVRLEIETNKDDKMRHMWAVVQDFQWDVSVDASEFEPVIPDDYTVGRPMMIFSPKKKPAESDEAEK
ncbi:MAG: LolA family protein [Planctomycetota bacterium]|jgi:outer membrane lipoprotein-sorting protein